MAEDHDGLSEFSAGESDVPRAYADVDVLSDVLRTIRLTAALFFPLEGCSPWADEIPVAAALASSIQPTAEHVVSYHVVSQGTCWLTLQHAQPVRLDAGDIVVIPHGDAYVMSSAPGMRAAVSADAVLTFFKQRASGSATSAVIEDGGGPERAHLVCGFLGCDIRPFNPVLDALPRLVHLRRADAVAVNDRLTPLVDFVSAESRQRRPGTHVVLLRLSEVLFIEVIRHYLDALPADRVGWLSGLRDPVVGHALALLHHRPADAWTLERLRREVGVSRSTLADRFTQLVGKPPMRYLAHWRMQFACRLLAAGTAKVSAVAFESGYQSEAAFSRAFKDVVGLSPAAWRRARGWRPA